MSLGLVAIVLGGVWTLQGLDVLPYSAMSGQTVWAAVGGALIMAGLLLIAVGMRRRSAGQKPVQ
ncbi:hypothetical protein [Actinoplanes flavus]|nr:hypothetical protein [Actinoplanes flavus]